jgi:acetylornithine deacetylase/succinyl-diaminopimelate desuccinylase-like protein
VLADDQIAVKQVGDAKPSDPAAIDEELLATIEKTSAEFWPGVPVVRIMSAGATDGLFLRNAGIPTYGHSGLASDVDDVRAHGKDERVAAKSFFDGGEYLHRLVRRLSGGT